jgi:hypothetical protein
MAAATTSVSGYLTSTDWTTFNNKGSGTVTSVTGTAPVVSSGGATPAISMPAATTSVNGYLTSTDWTTFNNKGSVTSVSVVSANGLAGTVATATTTPAITLSTTVTGLLKGNGTAISAATSGTDYAPATSGTSILYGNGSGGFSNVTIGTGVSFAAGTLSATGSGGTVTSVSGTTGRITSTGGTTPVIDLASGVATPGTTGSATLVPVVTIDTYGRVTSITTAANPQGTVTSVGGTGTVNGLTLTGTVTSSGNLTLGGTLDLSSPPAIGATSPSTVKATTIQGTDTTDASSTTTGALKTAGGLGVAKKAYFGDSIFMPTLLGSYQWSGWNPTDILGTVTNAPSTGTINDSAYITLSNSSGTVTCTFDVAGTYLVSVTGQDVHGNTYVVDRLIMILGGSSTRRISVNPTNSGDSANDMNMCFTATFLVTATAAQTLTVLPTYELVGAGTTAQHTAYAEMTVQFCGT